MIQLLFTITLIQMGLTLILVFKTPLRKLVIKGLDKMKQGRGPLMAKSVGGTMFVFFISSLYSAIEINNHSIETGVVNPTDQVLLAYLLLESSLMGFSLFLVLIIDRIHSYIRELYLLRSNLEEERRKNQIHSDSEEERAERSREGKSK